MLFPSLINNNADVINAEENTSSEEEFKFDDKYDIIKEKKKRKVKKSATKGFFDINSEEILTSSLNESNSVQLTFNDLNLSRPLLKAAFLAGFLQPTPIQQVCIPVILAGRDICACSATGTGKTAAFILPILERLLFRPKNRKPTTRVLILVPTRELAVQVFQVGQKLSQFNCANICLCAGGLDLKVQEAALRLCPDIVIATPGRLLEHLRNTSNFSLSEIEVLVLDEADRMLDESFGEQMKEIIKSCSKNHQTMLFSATMTDEIENLAQMSLKNPVRLFINENTDVAANLNQEFIRIRESREEDREAIVASLVKRTFTSHTIIFVSTKHGCQRLAAILKCMGLNVDELHGGLSQLKRIEALNKFKTRKLDILCSTDLAARGLDIEGVLTIINMHMPNELKRYIHRVGRTARAGNVGRAITLVGEKDRTMAKNIIKLHNDNRPLNQRTIDPETIESFKQQISELEGEIQRTIREKQFKLVPK